MNNISIIPFTSEILGVDENFVYLKEIYYSDEEKDEHKPCVVQVTRRDYLSMIELWLESKADFTQRYNHFCGVMGDFYVEDSIDIGDISILEENQSFEDEVLYVTVPIFRVLSFNKQCDMEHG